jgi:hypothetical protein
LDLESESSGDESTESSARSATGSAGSACSGPNALHSAQKLKGGLPNGAPAAAAPSRHDSDEEVQVPTMWLGTEDGCIHIYNFNDNVRTRRNKTKIQHPGPVHALVYAEDKVFASVGNAQLVVYDRDQGIIQFTLCSKRSDQRQVKTRALIGILRMISCEEK